MTNQLNPTRKTYTEVDRAYQVFNDRLFNGILPDCLITFQREHNANGYYCHNRFTSEKNHRKTLDEIALNPAYFRTFSRTDKHVLSTLLHEMCHLWQYHFGKPGRGRYHNAEWARKMKEVGLQPDDGNGKETGDSMSHTIVSGGKFEQVYADLRQTGFILEWVECSAGMLDILTRYGDDSESSERSTISAVIEKVRGKADEGEIELPAGENPKPKDPSKVKQTCPGCGLNVWAKQGAFIICGECNETLQHRP